MGFNLKNIKKGKKSIDNKKKASSKDYERYACYVVGLLITIGLELFCIAYYFIDDKSKKKTVYGLFIFGVALVLFAVIYTIVKVV